MVALYLASLLVGVACVTLSPDARNLVNSFTSHNTATIVERMEAHPDVVTELMAGEGPFKRLMTLPMAAYCRVMKGANRESSKAKSLFIIQSLVSHGADINYISDGNTLLWEAVKSDHLELAQFLLQSGATYDKVRVRGMTELAYSSSAFGYERIAKLLGDFGASCQQRDEKSHQTPLEIHLSKKRTLQSRLSRNLDIAHSVSTNGIAALTNSGTCSVNSPSIEGLLPLQQALNQFHSDVAYSLFIQLLQSGANVNKPSQEHITPFKSVLELAGNRVNLRRDLIELCFEAGGVYEDTVLVPRVDSRNPLGNAVATGDLDEVIRILESSDDPGINFQSKVLQYTPLMLAVKGNFNRIVKVLLESGANVHLTDSVGKSALGLALQLSRPSILSLLLNEESIGIDDIYKEDLYGDTPISIAFHRQDTGILWMLNYHFNHGYIKPGYIPLLPQHFIVPSAAVSLHRTFN